MVRTDGPGAALLVDLGGERPSVTPLPIARGRAQRLVLEPAAFPSVDALADPDLSLEVRLTDRARPTQFIDVVALERRLAPRFFSLEIADEAMPDLSLLEEPGRSVTVTGKFVGLWLLGERREPA